MLKFHVQTSGVSLTYQQPLNNAIRAGYQVLAAVLGGVQSLHVCSYNEAICIPTEESATLSVRTQQIIQNETNVTNTIDPLAGSYYVESLTDEVEKRAWDFFNEIEERGGRVKVIETRWLRDQVINEELWKYEEEKGEWWVSTVIRWRSKPGNITYFRPDPELADKLRKKAQKLKSERDDVRVEDALAELREADESGKNVMPAIMKAVKAYVTLEEINNIAIRRYPFAGASSTYYGLKGIR